MQSWRNVQSRVSDVMDQLESEALYGVLPLASHPRFLSFIRQSSAWISHQTQQVERVQTALIHRCHLAHQSDMTRTHVLVDEIKMTLRETVKVSSSSNEDHDILS